MKKRSFQNAILVLKQAGYKVGFFTRGKRTFLGIYEKDRLQLEMIITGGTVNNEDVVKLLEKAK
jgi:hypothetical protein